MSYGRNSGGWGANTSFKYPYMDDIINQFPVLQYIASQRTLEWIYLIWDLSISVSTWLGRPVPLFILPNVKNLLKRTLNRDIRDFGEHRLNDELLKLRSLMPKKKTRAKVEEEQKAHDHSVLEEELDESSPSPTTPVSTTDALSSQLSQGLAGAVEQQWHQNLQEHYEHGDPLASLLYDSPESNPSTLEEVREDEKTRVRQILSSLGVPPPFEHRRKASQSTSEGV